MTVNQAETSDAPASCTRQDESKARLDAILPDVYIELRALAAAMLRKEQPGHTLQVTAVIHEAYLKLSRQHSLPWGSRICFLAAASGVIRRLLVDHARTSNRIMRGRDWKRIDLERADDMLACEMPHLVELNEALEQLALRHERQAQVVEMRFFGGMTIGEVAHALGVSTRTIDEDWTVARAWLLRRLCEDDVE